MLGNNGSIGGSTNQPQIDDGTNILYQSSASKPIGMANQFTLNATAEGASRKLTQGEILMSQQLFKSAIRYTDVRVHNEGYFPFGLQNKGTAVTPNGEIYFLPADFLEDFAIATINDKAWFIHEMTHVWQYQLGYPVMLRGAIRIGLGYEYTLDDEKKFGDYNMEAQGDILRDYFVLKALESPGLVLNKKNTFPPTPYSIVDYEKTLKDFLENPSNKENLP